MTYVLRKTVGSWSAGTRVEIVDWTGPFAIEEGTLQVRVLAGDQPIIDVNETDVVERRERAKPLEVVRKED